MIILYPEQLMEMHILMPKEHQHGINKLNTGLGIPFYKEKSIEQREKRFQKSGALD
ncbi:MAG: hypothetical protein SFU99_15610 [Saprospiraceae bacterium]|nr:hypothetical protein [Saprospiraceae bacterium]